MKAEVGDFYDALNGMNKDYSAISWGGFNLFGDAKSIAEVHRLQSLESVVVALRNRIKELNDD